MFIVEGYWIGWGVKHLMGSSALAEINSNGK